MDLHRSEVGTSRVFYLLSCILHIICNVSGGVGSAEVYICVDSFIMTFHILNSSLNKRKGQKVSIPFKIYLKVYVQYHTRKFAIFMVSFSLVLVSLLRPHDRAVTYGP